MRAVFVGAGTLALTTAHSLLKRGHEVVIIERDKDRIDELTTELDCGFLHGDGSKPALLREADPDHTDMLFCLTGNDQANILASLVGRSLGFERVVTQIVDAEFEHICIELGLEDTIIPARTIGLHLADMFEGRDPLELSTMIRDEARAFSFVAGEADTRPIAELDLPGETRVICLYREDRLILPDEGTRLRAEDEVVCITHREHIAELEERFKPLIRNHR